MEYTGALFGKVGTKYIPLRMSSADVDGLLEALKRLINQFDSEIHNEYDGTVILEDRLSEADHARAAIAKAKGKTK